MSNHFEDYFAYLKNQKNYTEITIKDYKEHLIKFESYCNSENNSGKRGKIGIPMGLNFYELLPLYS